MSLPSDSLIGGKSTDQYGWGLKISRQLQRQRQQSAAANSSGDFWAKQGGWRGKCRADEKKERATAESCWKTSSGRWSLFDCGANTAAPVAKDASGASPLNGRSAKGAGSRPSCRLVLCNLLFQAGYPIGVLLLPVLQTSARAESCEGSHFAPHPHSLCTRRAPLSSTISGMSVSENSASVTYSRGRTSISGFQPVQGGPGQDEARGVYVA
jgi:hypothetical protein